MDVDDERLSRVIRADCIFGGTGTGRGSVMASVVGSFNGTEEAVFGDGT
jgi:hypothetical protein